MPRKTSCLNILLNGLLVGRLRRQSNGVVSFEYAASWLEWEHTFPVSLSLPLRDSPLSGDAVNAVFENLLPDNLTIRRTLAERCGARGADAYSLLSAVGRDCVGALQFIPEDLDPTSFSSGEDRRVGDEEIASILKSLAQNPLGVGNDEEFRISIAGAQEKTALLYRDSQWFIPHGSRPTTHIIKPAIARRGGEVDLSDSVENEYLCMKLCAAFGLPTANVEMIQFADKKALVVERFDRRLTADNRLLRIPQEDLCQALTVSPVQKYERDGGSGIKEALDLLRLSDFPDEDRSTFMKAQLVFWLLGATDGHAKNFSIRLLPGRARFHLAPLYDVMSTQPYVDRGELRQNQMKLAMAVGDSRHYLVKNITFRHFVETGSSNGLPNGLLASLWVEVHDTVESLMKSVLEALPRDFPEPLAASVTDGIRSRLISHEE